MKSCKKLLAILMAVAMLTALAVPAMASSEEPAVITGVALREADKNYVDSAIWSQYETVTFSDGTTQSINVDEQTFVLVKNGVVVDLADEANWTADAELYVVDKNMSDTVAMSMNTANWGPFWFTGVVELSDGAYNEAASIPAAQNGVTIDGTTVSGGQIDIDASYISAIYANGEEGDAYAVKDVVINSSGLGGNDFGTNCAWGGVIATAGSAEMDIDGVEVYTEGPLHDAIWAGGSSIVDVTDTVVFAVENAQKWNHQPYSYDKFIITDAPMSEEEIAELGISGEYYAEDYSGMFGSGTHYYYTNENYTSNYSAPMLQCVPLALGLYGSMRATCCYGSATLSFYDSLVVSDIWAVLSTDSGSGTLNATDTVAIIGAETDAANAEVTATVDGVEYYIDAYDTTQGTGYVTYCDGFDDNFYGCTFYAPDYLAILTGGTFDFTESETQRGFGRSDRIGFMSHGRAYTAVLSHSDFEVSDALYSVMSTGAVDITLDDVTVDLFGDNPWGGVLFQFMDTDDTGTDANDLEMDVIDLTYEEYMSIEASNASGEPTPKTVTIKNSALAGDIWNSTGSSNNASTLAKYDGSTNVLSTWDTSIVNVTLDNSTLDGMISTSYAQHCDENGEPIVGQFFFNKTGEPMDGTAENTYNYLAARRIINTPAYNGIGKINVTLTNGAVWNVTGEGIINSLTVEDGCTVNGIVTENADGTITVSPAAVTLPAEGGQPVGEAYPHFAEFQDYVAEYALADDFMASQNGIPEDIYTATNPYGIPFCDINIVIGAMSYVDWMAANYPGVEYSAE